MELYRNVKESKFIDANLFKAFAAAAATKNFTNAAALANMTQPGVSQHIARLEEAVGQPLFKRLTRQVELTDSGKIVAKFIEKQSVLSRNFFNSIQTQHNELAGFVSFAIPSSLILEHYMDSWMTKLNESTEIKLNIKILPSHETIQSLLSNKLDFGFVIGSSSIPGLISNRLHEDSLILAGSTPFQSNNNISATLRKKKYIMYPDAEELYTCWFQHYFPSQPLLMDKELHFAGRISSMEGAINMVKCGLGLGIFPESCIQDLLSQNTLFSYNSDDVPSYNLDLVTFENQWLPQRVVYIINQCLDAYKEEDSKVKSEKKMSNNIS
jgi:DNA-binding transcriptional LysR family regulator